MSDFQTHISCWAWPHRHQSLKLGTGISLIPERNPLILAKTISAFDLYSQGRFLLGVGGGWLREETEIMGGDFDHVESNKRIHTVHEGTVDERRSILQRESLQLPASKMLSQTIPETPPSHTSRRIFKQSISTVVEYADGWIPVGLT
ncbi:MAG: hypothetical protein CM1200mP15_16520 [Dehalococcoidia bacterium]|nr:MAG: hypothetical protein CM1200mP15_16520 [Dehalococcoidia bacterium]